MRTSLRKRKHEERLYLSRSTAWDAKLVLAINAGQNHIFVTPHSDKPPVSFSDTPPAFEGPPEGMVLESGLRAAIEHYARKSQGLVNLRHPKGGAEIGQPEDDVIMRSRLFLGFWQDRTFLSDKKVSRTKSEFDNMHCMGMEGKSNGQAIGPREYDRAFKDLFGLKAGPSQTHCMLKGDTWSSNTGLKRQGDVEPLAAPIQYGVLLPAHSNQYEDDTRNQRGIQQNLRAQQGN
ncbi:hypothetical protein GALMADRAFT_1361063 [Galerina marginata CBS 339.88]|uniref:Uncharacterized protein n=1 Tax=Galerina marginata (strain CBS 339.88) TaxID=685588 RepID=A0A067TAC8_GALM3|nr:hypothetical protein GALMADRAFT_1361063 [Galerina marginata CBS 339.88]